MMVQYHLLYAHVSACSLHITDILLLEKKIEEMKKTFKMQEDKLENQGLLLQGLLKRVEELEENVKINNRPVDKANQPNSSDVQNHFVDDFLDYTYSPPPLPPPLRDSILPTMPLPPTATTLSQLCATPSTPVPSQPSQQPHIASSATSRGSVPPLLATRDIPQTSSTDCTVQPAENVHCIPVTPKPSTATLPADAIDKAKLVSPAQTLHRYPKLRTEGKASVLAVKLARESFFGETAMSQCTMMGCGKYPALPTTLVNSLKQTLFSLFPRCWPNPVLFEGIWKECVEAIGQACKRVRAEQEKRSKIML